MVLCTFYGGMTCIAGVLGAKQVALGPLAVEAGIFPFLMLVATSTAVAGVYGRACAQALVAMGFVPLASAILLTVITIQLPTDPGMYEPAKAAFPIVLGQGWRLMLAGVVAYGVSMTLNVHVFLRLRDRIGRSALSGALASMLSQAVDTVVFITVAFLGTRPLGALMLGQALAKVVLSAVLVPGAVALMVTLCRRWDGRAIVVERASP